MITLKNCDPFYAHWSNTFLNKCIHYINQIHKFNYNVKIIGNITTNISINDKYKNYLMDIAVNIFNNPIKYNIMLKKYLSDEQILLMIELFKNKIVNSLDDFHYTLAHLPFYKDIIECLIQNKHPTIELPPFFKEYICNIFISPSIQSWIFANCNTLLSIHLIINDINVHLEILYPNNKIIPVKAIIEVISQSLNTVIELYKVKIKHDLHLIYIPTQFKKNINNFPKNSYIDQFFIDHLKKHKNLKYNYQHFNNPISSLNVNSGVTIARATRPLFISIWREQEFNKVLIHELIHYYNVEKGNNFDLPINVNISNNYPHFSKELFTELQTWLLFTLINASNMGINNNKDIQNLLDYERYYAIINIYRIFNHFGITNFKQFFGNDNKFIINANSSILYYYILKGCLLFHINNFMEWLLLPDQTCDTCKKKSNIKMIESIQSLYNNQQLAYFYDNISLAKPIFDDCLNMMQCNVPIHPFYVKFKHVTI